tara:strand:- start:571 stop:1323 length:753 start_codon:yes stop_codon:yes gene_type:complete
MADKKISALTAATTPLAGTEVLPIVQSSATVKVAVSDLTAGRAVATAALSATGIILTTDATDASSTTAASLKTAGGLAVVKKTYVGDNIVQGTAAKGFDFIANTPRAGMTSQLLNWYEEGSYTVTLFDAAGGGNASATTVTGRYTRIGNLVNCSFSGLNAISTAGMTAGNTLYISLPFTASSTGTGTGSFASENIAFGTGRTNVIPVALNSNARAIFRAYGSGVSTASLIVSNVTSGSANIDYFSLSYRV